MTPPPAGLQCLSCCANGILSSRVNFSFVNNEWLLATNGMIKPKLLNITHTSSTTPAAIVRPPAMCACFTSQGTWKPVSTHSLLRSHMNREVGTRRRSHPCYDFLGKGRSGRREKCYSLHSHHQMKNKCHSV
jgi:hypothetical protein